MNGYINKYWYNASKIPVYIGYFYGNEYEARQEEKMIKNMSISKKKELIDSEKNMLVGYKPLKHIILKKNGGEGEILLEIG
jgi:predicted GIY-YIG superfamily endonuclease